MEPRATEDSIRYSIGVNREVEFKIWRGGYISTIYIEPRDYNFRVTDIKIIAPAISVTLGWTHSM